MLFSLKWDKFAPWISIGTLLYVINIAYNLDQSRQIMREGIELFTTASTCYKDQRSLKDKLESNPTDLNLLADYTQKIAQCVSLEMQI